MEDTSEESFGDADDVPVDLVNIKLEPIADCMDEEFNIHTLVNHEELAGDLSGQSGQQDMMPEVSDFFCSDLSLHDYISPPPPPPHVESSTASNNNNEEKQIVVHRNQCHLCFKQCKTPHDLKRHMLTHSAVKTFKCNLCSNSFKHSRSLLRHTKTAHIKKENNDDASALKHTCELCKKSYVNEFILNRHIYAVHNIKEDKVHLILDINDDVETIAKKNNLVKTDKNLPVTINTEVIQQNYSCNLCNKYFKSNYSYIKHKKTEHINIKLETIKCNECSYTTTNSKYLQRHMIKHKNTRPFICKICNTSFKDKRTLKRHQVIIHTVNIEIVSSLYCDSCHTSIPNKEALLKHVEKFHGLNNEKSQCTQCQHKTSRSANLRRHLSKHSDNLPFTCDDCGKKYKTKDNLRTHTKKVHGPKLKQRTVKESSSGDRVLCTLCKKCFNGRSDLGRHLDTVHQFGKKVFTCNICSYSTSIQYRLKEHSVIHAAIALYKCDVCAMEFKAARYLKRHYSRVHKIEYVVKKVTQNENNNIVKPRIKARTCSHCLKYFNTKLELLEHLKTVHGLERPSFNCQFCSYVTVEKYKLKRHQKIHEKHPCKICDVEFRYLRELKLHELLVHRVQQGRQTQSTSSK